MNTPSLHVSVLAEKQAFSAGEQFMSPVIKKGRKKKKKEQSGQHSALS